MKYQCVNIFLTPVSHCAQVVLDQTDRDKNVKQLLEVMNDVYSFVNEAELVKERVESQKRIVALMVEQTIQCAYFIRDYSADIHFGTTFPYFCKEINSNWSQENVCGTTRCQTLTARSRNSKTISERSKGHLTTEPRLSPKLRPFKPWTLSST